MLFYDECFVDVVFVVVVVCLGWDGFELVFLCGGLDLVGVVFEELWYLE